MTTRQAHHVIDQELTAAAMQKADEIKQAFLDWSGSMTNDANMLTKLYNERFNTNVPPTYDGSHLELVGASEAVKLRPHQKNAVCAPFRKGHVCSTMWWEQGKRWPVSLR